MFSLIPLPYRILAFVFLIASVDATGYIKGKSAEQGEQAKAMVEALAKATKIEAKIATAVEKAEVVAVARTEKTKIVYREIVKEVIKYAETPTGRTVCIDSEWVRSHNRAANPDQSEAPGSDAPSPAGTVTLAQSLGVVTLNYQKCNEWRDTVIGWQNWYKASQP